MFIQKTRSYDDILLTDSELLKTGLYMLSKH